MCLDQLLYLTDFFWYSFSWSLEYKNRTEFQCPIRCTYFTRSRATIKKYVLCFYKMFLNILVKWRLESAYNALFHIINISKGHNDYNNRKSALIVVLVRDVDDINQSYEYHKHLAKIVHVRVLTMQISIQSIFPRGITKNSVQGTDWYDRILRSIHKQYFKYWHNKTAPNLDWD